ncbi:DNA replication and repair protein RecF [Trichinella spiralis]|uniref:DNA replication and repair protein RecF n=1 Tax=Trichinella spiralis TaxID=6334 RepID=A0ABR3KDB1_TRISP
MGCRRVDKIASLQHAVLIRVLMTKMDRGNGKTFDVWNLHGGTYNAHILLAVLLMILYLLIRELIPRMRRRFPGHRAVENKRIHFPRRKRK